MFTGIIQELGKTIQIKNIGKIRGIKIKTEKLKTQIKEGASISVNGVCLTITKIYFDCFFVEITYETLNITTLKWLKQNEYVNLELALGISARFDGHIVLGHTDAIGEISMIRKKNGFKMMEIIYPKELKKYVVPKGSIAIDGISLTIFNVYNNKIIFNLIPYTLKSTTLGVKNISDKVNIEIDILAKYIEKLCKGKEKITKEILTKYGYK